MKNKYILTGLAIAFAVSLSGCRFTDKPNPVDPGQPTKPPISDPKDPAIIHLARSEQCIVVQSTNQRRLQ